MDQKKPAIPKDYLGREIQPGDYFCHALFAEGVSVGQVIEIARGQVHARKFRLAPENQVETFTSWIHTPWRVLVISADSLPVAVRNLLKPA